MFALVCAEKVVGRAGNATTRAIKIFDHAQDAEVSVIKLSTRAMKTFGRVESEVARTEIALARKNL